MKQKKGLIVLLAMLLVLCGIYFAMRSYNEKQEEQKAEEEKADVVRVVDIEEPVEITYSADDGSSIALVKEDGTWYLKDDKETELVQDTIQNIADTVSGVDAEKQIEDPDPLESYGLDAPSYTVTVTGEDGTTETIYIGDGADEDYYMTTGDKEHVYIVTADLVNILDFDKDNLKVAEDDGEASDESTDTESTDTASGTNTTEE